MSDNLLIGVCCTKSDFFKNQVSLYHSLSNLVEAFGKNIFVYFIIQTKEEKKHDCGFSLSCDMEVFYETKMGISHARNLCIDKANEINAKYILFHDASICWTKSAAKFIFNNIGKYHVVKANVLFDVFIDDDVDIASKVLSVNPIYNSYVWSYIFSVELIGNIRFDETRGPGENTYYKCGEDVLFLFDYFNRISSFKVLSSIRGGYVIHPKRELDYSKHLFYAEGQGNLFKVLIKKYRRPSLYFDLLMFFGNTIVRCIWMRKNAFLIMKKRIIGFIKG